MPEYAVVDDKGNVISIFLTNKPFAEAQAIYREPFKVVPVDDVPEERLKQYQFWDERP